MTTLPPFRVSSTLLRDFEHCPMKAALKIQQGIYTAKVGNHSLQMAAGVTFDALVRRRLKEDTALVPGLADHSDIEERQNAWIPERLRREAEAWGKWWFDGYVRSGAYDGLLEEGIIDADPPEWHDKEIEGVPVTCRPDLMLKPSAELAYPVRILDWKTTGLLGKNGGYGRPGYVYGWQDGEKTPGDGKEPHGEGDTPVAHWFTQLGIYCLQWGTPYAGVELLVAGPRKAYVDVLSYRWEFTDEYFGRLKTRLIECWNTLRGHDHKANPSASACYTYKRLCDVASECQPYKDWRASK